MTPFFAPEDIQPTSVIAKKEAASFAHVSFTELGPFLQWMDETLAEHDASDLVTNQTHEAEFSGKLHDVELMKKSLGQRTLSEVFEAQQFPPLENDFKLGGHSGLLPHVHIDFKRNEDSSWSLYRIWTCR